MIFEILEYFVGLIKMLIYKLFYLNKLNFYLLSRISYKSSIRLINKGQFILGKNIIIKSGVKIRATKNGKIFLGNNSGFNSNCLINCQHEISIGQNTMFGQNVMLYDHDHLFDKSGTKHRKFKTAPIHIGDNVWIGSGCIILKGVTIGDNSVIAAGTLINKDIPSGSIVYNKKEMIIKEI